MSSRLVEEVMRRRSEWRGGLSGIAVPGIVVAVAHDEVLLAWENRDTGDEQADNQGNP